MWHQPNIVSTLAGKICIPNLSSKLHTFKRDKHFCQVNLVFKPKTTVLHVCHPVYQHLVLTSPIILPLC